MAPTVTGKLNRDVRLDADGRIASGGRLYLRGETVAVHRDCADDLFHKQAKVKKARAPLQDKQVVPPQTKEI